MGKITCANVLSDLFAMGVVNCDHLVMMISVCTQMEDNERNVIMPIIVEGFKDNAVSAGVNPICQTSSFNPWCIIGGIATSVCTPDEYVVPTNAQIGDALIVTKPVGCQMACNVHRWMEDDIRWEKISKVVTSEEVQIAFQHAVQSMGRLNQTAAKLMHKYKAHAATDVTGFGLLGHAKNLAENQTQNVKFVIHTMPVIAKMAAVAKAIGNSKFLAGTTPETSGGLFICLPKENAADFCADILLEDGLPAWIVGEVVEGDKTAEVVENPTVIEVEFTD